MYKYWFSCKFTAKICQSSENVPAEKLSRKSRQTHTERTRVDKVPQPIADNNAHILLLSKCLRMCVCRSVCVQVFIWYVSSGEVRTNRIKDSQHFGDQRLAKVPKNTPRGHWNNNRFLSCSPFPHSLSIPFSPCCVCLAGCIYKCVALWPIEANSFGLVQ